MEISHFVLYTLVILNISSIASSLKCEVCGPEGEPCDGSNVTSVECASWADRCMTVSMTIRSKTMMAKNCAHSTFSCQEQTQDSFCERAALGGSCNIECCEGDLCNQASSEVDNTTAHNVTNSGVAGSEATLPNFGSCTFMEYFCDVRKCNTAFVKGLQKGSYGNCSAKFNKMISCVRKTVDICVGGVLSQSQIDNILRQNFKENTLCLDGGVDVPTMPPIGSPCSDTFSSDTNDCMRTLRQKFVADKSDPALCPENTKAKRCMKNLIDSKCKFPSLAQKMLDLGLGDYNPYCAYNRDPGATGNDQCYGVKELRNFTSGTGTPVGINTSQPTKATVKTSSLKCQACAPIGDPCDGGNVTSVDCGSLEDRCITVSIKVGHKTTLVKNCGFSTLSCQEQSEYHPCKFTPIGASTCKVTCCEGDMCNLASPSTTVAPSTTFNSPPTPPGTEPPPAVVKGGFFKVNSSPVCFGSKNDEYGRFSVPSTGDLAAIKLVHLFGYVACYSRAKWSIWGCGGPKVNVVITTSANDVILPPAVFSDAGHWAIIPGYTSLSPELVLSVFSRPRPVTSGEEFHLWYGEDFVDAREGDNRGTVCSDVYALIF